jgi:hypothetical protein
MKEILVDGGEFGFQNLAKNRNDFGIAFHVVILG